ncbi:hypothetical protein VTJ83DRAFT_5242 [Remersonia thermophila]|uniref:Uncharacterized protein n=1 Tax=Remersonia thermophila TaxID=72144 RepID=A0ABR4DC99_9PEZI
MSTEVFRRTGRGGAGNYYFGRKKKLSELQRAADPAPVPSVPEQQPQPQLQLQPQPQTQAATLDPDPPLIRIQTQTFSGRTRTGRGGAGNFGPAWAAAAAADCGDSSLNDPERASRRQEAASGADSLAAKAKVAVAAINLAAKARVGGSGRGGAGNWSGHPAAVTNSTSSANSVVSGSSGASLMSRSTTSNGDRVIRWMKSAEWRHWRRGAQSEATYSGGSVWED